MTAQRVGPITPEWVRAYALASGDDNRLHQPAPGHTGIVHGALLLALLERFARETLSPGRIVDLEARFLRPVPIGSTLELALGASRTTLWQGESATEHRLTARVTGQSPSVLGSVIVVG